MTMLEQSFRNLLLAQAEQKRLLRNAATGLSALTAQPATRDRAAWTADADRFRDDVNKHTAQLTTISRRIDAIAQLLREPLTQ